jgi:23S rRNA (adenine2030-N6)-methyltransferase
MNYRHAYHAGSFVDVVKHAVLLQMLEYLQKKPTPYCYIDTHAGEGCYDLTSDVTQKTQEAQQGVQQLRLQAKTHPASLDSYFHGIRDINIYPGSPMWAAQLARPTDSMILNEKHASTYQHLKECFRGYSHVAIHQRDAYEFLPAVIPPPEKRGLVLIDPAFEDEHEMQYLINCLNKCFQRWPTGMYLIWIPMVGRSYYTANDLMHAGFKKYLTIEFCVNSPKNAAGLIGCSLLLINPPWQIETQLNPVLEYLWQVLHIDADSTWSLKIQSDD